MNLKYLSKLKKGISYERATLYNEKEARLIATSVYTMYICDDVICSNKLILINKEYRVLFLVLI